MQSSSALFCLLFFLLLLSMFSPSLTCNGFFPNFHPFVPAWPPQYEGTAGVSSWHALPSPAINLLVPPNILLGVLSTCAMGVNVPRNFPGPPRARRPPQYDGASFVSRHALPSPAINWLVPPNSLRPVGARAPPPPPFPFSNVT